MKSFPTRRAFTIIELLVAIAIMIVLLLLLMPNFANARERGRIAVCSSNLHENSALLIAHALRQDNKLISGKQFSGNWMWDLSVEIRDTMTSMGSHRDTFYCPSGGFQNDETLWNYDPNFTVTGYFWFMARPGNVGNRVLDNGKSFVSKLGSKRDDRIELAADATLSVGGNFAKVVGGWPNAHRSSHLINRTQPAGGNIAFLDGHVAWRPFKEMVRGDTGPDQWW